MVLTEDTGKIFEMAICLTYGIPYDGPFRYRMEDAEQLSQKLTRLTQLFPTPNHSARRGARYDFTGIDDPTQHLSAKSSKKGVAKVAAQVVGQSQPKKFCESLNIEYTTIPALKQYIQTEPTRVLDMITHYTFDCPNVYYNKERDIIQYIRLTTPIEWKNYDFKWTCDWNKWKNSSTLKIVVRGKEFSLVEFQFHTKNRTNMAVRWFYDNFLMIFKDNLTILELM